MKNSNQKHQMTKLFILFALVFFSCSKKTPYQVVYQITTGNEQNIAIMDYNGKHQRVLTENQGNNLFPAISPYGHIAFTSTRAGGIDIYIMEMDGSHQRQMTTKGLNTMPAWSPKGNLLAYSSQREKRKEDIYLLNVVTGKEVRATKSPASENRPCWSADGEKIYFDSDRGGNSDIYVLDLKTGKEKRLTSHPAVDTDPVCTADGRVFFSSSRQGNTYQVFSIDKNGTIQQVSKETTSNNAYPAWLEDKGLYYLNWKNNTDPFNLILHPDNMAEEIILKQEFAFDPCGVKIKEEKPSWTSRIGERSQQPVFLPPIADTIIGEIGVDTVIVIGSYGEQVARYMLTLENTTGKKLTDVTFDVYLEKYGKRGILSFTIGTLEKNQTKKFQWALDKSTPLGKTTSSDYLHAFSQKMIPSSPTIFGLIRSQQGIYECQPTYVYTYMPINKETYQGYLETRLADSYPTFKRLFSENGDFPVRKNNN